MKIEATTGSGYSIMLGPPEYLLFLKRTADGRLEPVSGQIDPALSVREMHRPLPAGLGPK